MGYLADATLATLPVPGPDGKPDPSGATVTFRGMATLDDELLLARLIQKYNEIPDEQERQHAFRAERALLMVDDWTLTDEKGDPLPRTPDVLRRKLSRRVAAWIETESIRRYEGREEDAEGPFVTPSAQR